MTETELYDVVIPPGVPQKVIKQLVEQFPGEIVESRQRLHFANMDGDERDLLAFRSDLETAQAVEQFIYDQLKNFIGVE